MELDSSLGHGFASFHDNRAFSVEQRSVLGVGGAHVSLPKRVLDFLLVLPNEAARLSFSKLLFGQLLNVEDLNLGATGLMVSGHFGIHLLNSAVGGGVTVLLEGVVNTDVGAVFQVDTVVLRATSVFLEDFLNLEELGLGAAQLEVAQVELPEAGTGEDSIGSVDASSDYLRLGVLLGRGRSCVNQEASTSCSGGFIQLDFLGH